MMPKKRWSAHDERKYNGILASCKKSRGRKKGVTKICKRIAAATVERDLGLSALNLNPRIGVGSIHARGMGAQLLSVGLGRLSTNREGLTFEEWRRAAGVAPSTKGVHAAWARGEDPTDWRASLQVTTPAASSMRGLRGWEPGDRRIKSGAWIKSKGNRVAILSDAEDPQAPPGRGEVYLTVRERTGDDGSIELAEEYLPSIAAADVVTKRLGLEGLGCACADAPSGLGGRKRKTRKR